MLERNPVAEREALERIATWAGQYTPMACLDPPTGPFPREGETFSGVVLEVEASLKLFGGHARLTAAIRKGVRSLGYSATLGIAPTPLAARLFARAEAQGRPVRGCLTLAELRERVAELPLFLLDWPGETLARLTDLGILRVRDALQLPAEGLARRFGPQVVLGLEQLMGLASDPRKPHVPPQRFRSRIELPGDVDGVQPLLFPLKRLLTELEGALRGRGAGVQELSLWLEHGRDASTCLSLSFASPEREADFILGIAREKLGRLVLPAATCALDLRAEALLTYTPRSSTWLPGAREHAIDRERLIERLVARMGKERVFGIALADDHRPERDWAPAYAGATNPRQGATNTRQGATNPRQGMANPRHPGRGNAAEPAPAIFKPGARDPIPPRPTWLLQRPHRLVTQQGQPTLHGALTLHAGPERIESGWWDGEEVRRDYYMADNPRGETYWIYREHRDPSSWYLHGVFA